MVRKTTGYEPACKKNSYGIIGLIMMIAAFLLGL